MPRTNPNRDEACEERILMEIIVDAYGEEERAMGWYYYLQDTLRFPFKATCIVKRSISPLKVKDRVKVIGMPGEDECDREVFVTIERGDGDLAVPLSQLHPVAATDDETTQAVEDWHYWVNMGYVY